MSFVEWEQAKDIVRRAQCTACGAKGMRVLSLDRVRFLSEGEIEKHLVERKMGGR